MMNIKSELLEVRAADSNVLSKILKSENQIEASDIKQDLLGSTNNIQTFIKSEPLVFSEETLKSLNLLNPFNCDHCSYGTDTVTNLFEHNLKEHRHETQKFNPLQCNVCNKIFKYKRTLERHKQRQHPNFGTDVKQQVEDVKPVHMRNDIFKHEQSSERLRQKQHPYCNGDDNVIMEQLSCTKETVTHRDNCSKGLEFKRPLESRKRLREWGPIDMNENSDVKKQTSVTQTSSVAWCASKVYPLHQNSSKNAKMEQPPKQLTRSGNGVIACNVCHKNFTRLSTLIRHKRRGNCRKNIEK